jgi:hypothetical protein
MRAPALRFLPLLAALLAPAVSGAAEQSVPLAFKFTPGDVVTYEVSFSGSGGLRSPDGDLAPVGIQGRCDIKHTVSEVLPDGSGKVQILMPTAEVSVTIGSERARFSYTGGRLRWYANGKEHSPPEADLSRIPLLGAPVVATIAPNGRVSDLLLPDAQMTAALQQAVPGLNLAQSQGFGQQVFPDAPLKVGETWRHTARLSPLGPAMPIIANVSRTLESYDEQGGIGLARIRGFAEARVQGSSLPLPGAGDVKVAIPEVHQTVTSTEFFNTTLGRLIRGDYDLSFSTRVSVEVGEEQKDAGLEARLHMSVQAR